MERFIEEARFSRMENEYLEPPADEPEEDEDEADFYADQELVDLELNRDEE